MADDIDIEEHDVLESLRRRQQPDASIVKSEPLDVEYEESNYEDSNYEYQWEWEKDKVEIKVEPHADEFQFGKIILGSKPAEPQDQTPGGSQDGDDEDIRDEDYNYNMSLVLDDWGPILERSDCYCQTCETLFATVNALDAHKMIAHSFLVATDKQPSPERNKAFKSTAKPTASNSGDDNTCRICQFQFKGQAGKFNLLRHYKRTHQVDPATLKSWKVCNHCNLYFPDDTSLVKHLYELLPLNDKTPTKDNKKVVGLPKPKPVLNVDKNISKPANTTNVKLVNSPAKKDVPSTTIPNRIILGSKPMAVQSENNDDDTKKRKCEICSIEYVKKYYHIHMEKFHSDFLSKKQTQPNKIILSDARVRYKCQICREILTGEYAMKKHRFKHPDMKKKRILVKLVNKAIAKPNLPIKKEPEIKPNIIKKEQDFDVKKEVEDSKVVLVPKTALFKCNRCSVHFLTCSGACQHSIVCETSSNIGDWACPQCQRVFKSTEKSLHGQQHKMLNANKFRVYVVYLEMIVRILCQCPNCSVCFEEDKFWRHINGGCTDAASSFCNECKLSIDIQSKGNHDSKHRKGDFTKDDFIKIEYVASKLIVSPKKIKTEVEVKRPKVKLEETPKRGLKRKLETSAVPQKKQRMSRFDELVLYYCQLCKSYLGNKSDVHVSGSCKVRVKGTRSFCKYCGIYLKTANHKTHMSLHIKIPNLTIADITFIKLADSKKMKPVQEFHPCKTCKVNFFTKAAIHVHKCKETASTLCKICQKKIQADLFDTHMRIHNYVIPREIKKIDEMIQTPNTSLNDTKSPMTHTLPDLMMKYQSLTALWNILYLCAICDTFTDSYDKVVEHCQNHLTNMENYGVVIMKCEICDMKFDSECYKRHLELHAGNKVISKKTFQILKFEHYNLFSDNWFDFIDLPEEQKSQILRRSIYGENRCVKMKLLQQGPPEYTLYKCEKCSNCVVTDTIVYHVKLANCLKANKIRCSVCDMTFASRRDREEHERIHEATGLGLESFRIISFNDADDASANQTIMSYDTANHGSKSRISLVDEEIAPSHIVSVNSAPLKSLVFYKCAECLTCVKHLKNYPKHACSSKGSKQCYKCGLSFRKIGNHERLHQRYAFSRKNILIKTVNKDGNVINTKKPSQETNMAVGQVNENAEQKSKLYKCFCGLHYTSLKAIEKHYKMKNCSTVIREKCSQCNLVFDPIEVVNHLCKHHAQNEVMAFNIVTPNKKTLYKCGLCNVFFYNKAVAIPHKAKCTGKFCGKKCVKCGLAFDPTSLATHMVDHERNNKLRNDCYVVVKIPDEKMTESVTGTPTNTLYKCKTCEIHFLRRSSARNHLIKRSNCGTTNAEMCKICKRKFPTMSILKHVSWHHNKLKIKEFHVKELALGVNTKFPRKNDEILKAKVKKEEEAMLVKKEPVHVTVYRCIKCMLLFTDKSSLLTHLEDRCSKELTDECEECNVKFASKNIKEHNREHGPGVALSMTIIEDIQVPEIPDEVKLERKVNRTPNTPAESPLDKYDNKLYKCPECTLHFLNKTTLKYHECKPTEIFVCDLCEYTFTKLSLQRHKLIHEKFNFKREDFVIITLADEAQTPDDAKTERKEIIVDPAPPKPKIDEYDSKLYRCVACNIHYLSVSTLLKHNTNCNPDLGVKCEQCDIAFTQSSLKRHKAIHEKHNLKKEDFVIITLADDVWGPQSLEDVNRRKQVIGAPSRPKKYSLDRYGNKIYKCLECNLHYLTHGTLLKHNCNSDFGLKCEVCDLSFTQISLTRHKLIHEKFNYKKEDFVILTLADVLIDPRSSGSAVEIKQDIEEATLNSSLELESTEKSPDKTKTDSSEESLVNHKKESAANLPGKSKIEEAKNAHTLNIIHSLFKCAECNVYYTTRVSCLKHIAKHTPLDPKEYIECKLCSFQFTLMGLPAHIKKNHGNVFNLQEVVVEEYQPNDVKKHETYYASEKDQSTLVSTSEDVRNSNLREEKECEVSSCNEIVENVDSTDSTQPDIEDKRKVGHSSSDFKELTETNDNILADSSEGDETEVSDQSSTLEVITESNSSQVGVTIDSSNDNTQVSKDVDKTELIAQDSNILNAMTESDSKDDNVLDPLDNVTQVNIDDVTKVDQVTNDLKESTELNSSNDLIMNSSNVKTD